MFEPDRLPLTALDPDTGAKILVGSSADMDTLSVTVRLPDGESVSFGVGLESRPVRAGYSAERANTFKIRLHLAEINRLAEFKNGTRRENTQFVQYVLSGLSVIRRKWRIVEGGLFYTDRYFYEGRDLKFLFSFDVPDEEEISRL